MVSAPGWLVNVGLLLVAVVVVYVWWSGKSSEKDEGTVLKWMVFVVGLGVAWLCVVSLLMEVVYVGGVVGCRFAPEEVLNMAQGTEMPSEGQYKEFKGKYGVNRMVHAMGAKDTNLINQDQQVLEHYSTFEKNSATILKYDQTPLP